MIVTVRPRLGPSGVAGTSGAVPSVTVAAPPVDAARHVEENTRLARELKATGNALFNDREYAKAAAAFGSALRIVQHGSQLQASLFANRSAAYLKWNQPELAAADAQAAILTSPREIKSYFRLARALDQMGRAQLAAHVCEWGIREGIGATDRQVAQLTALLEATRASADECGESHEAASPHAVSMRLVVRLPRSRAPALACASPLPPSGGGADTRTLQLLTSGDSGVFLQTLSNVLHVPRARLKVICGGKLLRDSNALQLVHAAASRLPAGKQLCLTVMGDPTADESDVDARSVEILIRQLDLDRREAVARLRAADGELLTALLR